MAQSGSTTLNKSNKHKIRASGVNAYVERGADPRFDAFWSEYPRKVGKGAAWRAWRKLGSNGPSEELFRRIMAGLRRCKTTPEWVEGRFIPNPSTWLNQGRWDDQPEEVLSRPFDPENDPQAAYCMRVLTGEIAEKDVQAW